AQALAVAIVLTAAVGIFEHIEANYEAGPLDQRYAYTWDTLSEADRWWAAITKAVGPSPPLAPGALAQGGLCLIFATLRHPALAAGREPKRRRSGEPAPARRTA